uniref:Uncharacterized protein n=1 Tax=Plectus sambesii TaxID=2011161 RepID=A0A914VN56_9BILA
MTIGNDWDFLSRESQEELAKNDFVQRQVVQQERIQESIRAAPLHKVVEQSAVKIRKIEEIAAPSLSASSAATSRFSPLADVPSAERYLMSLESMESVAMVVDVNPKCGRLLIPENVSKPNLIVFFDLNTMLDDQPIRAFSDNVQDIIQPGLLVDVVIEASEANLGPGRIISRGVVRCSKMTTYGEHSHFNNTDAQSDGQQTFIVDDARKEEPAMVIGVRQSGLGAATTVESEMLLLHSHALVNEELMAAIGNFDSSSSPAALRVIDQIKPALLSESDLMTPGRVVMTRMATTPAWIRQLSAELRSFRYIALSVRSGDTRQGVGKIVKYLESGGLLQPDCGDEETSDVIYFALSYLPKTQCNDLKVAWPVGSCLQYEACRELPGREFEFRAFRLSVRDGTMTSFTTPASNNLPIVPLIQRETTQSSGTDAISHRLNGLTVPLKSTFEPKKASPLINGVASSLPSSSSASTPPPPANKQSMPPSTRAKRRRLKARTYAADRLGCSDQSETDDDGPLEATATETNGASTVAGDPQVAKSGFRNATLIDQGADLFTALSASASQREEQPTEQSSKPQNETTGADATTKKTQPAATTASDSKAILISRGADLFETLSAASFQPSAATPTTPIAKQSAEKVEDLEEDLSDIDIADHKDKVLVVGPNKRMELITRVELKQRQEKCKADEKQNESSPANPSCSADVASTASSPPLKTAITANCLTLKTTLTTTSSDLTSSESGHSTEVKNSPLINDCPRPSEESSEKLALGMMTESELEMLKFLAPETMKFLGL